MFKKWQKIGKTSPKATDRTVLLVYNNDMSIDTKIFTFWLPGQCDFPALGF